MGSTSADEKQPRSQTWDQVLRYKYLEVHAPTSNLITDEGQIQYKVYKYFIFIPYKYF